MNGIFLITHKGLGEAFLKTLHHILGEIPPALALLELNEGDIPTMLEEKALETLHKLNTPGVLVLTDLFGASPANLANLLLKEKKVEVLSGLNLGMLLRAVHYRNGELSVMREKATSGALDAIVNARDFF